MKPLQFRQFPLQRSKKTLKRTLVQVHTSNTKLIRLRQPAASEAQAFESLGVAQQERAQVFFGAGDAFEFEGGEFREGEVLQEGPERKAEFRAGGVVSVEREAEVG